MREWELRKMMLFVVVASILDRTVVVVVATLFGTVVVIVQCFPCLKTKKQTKDNKRHEKDRKGNKWGGHHELLIYCSR